MRSHVTAVQLIGKLSDDVSSDVTAGGCAQELQLYGITFSVEVRSGCHILSDGGSLTKQIRDFAKIQFCE